MLWQRRLGSPYRSDVRGKVVVIDDNAEIASDDTGAQVFDDESEADPEPETTTINRLILGVPNSFT